MTENYRCSQCSTLSCVVMVPLIEQDTHEQWHDLHDAWIRACAATTRSGYFRDAFRVEIAAHEALLEWVRSEGLQGTRYDPRGQERSGDGGGYANQRRQ